MSLPFLNRVFAPIDTFDSDFINPLRLSFLPPTYHLQRCFILLLMIHSVIIYFLFL